MPQSKILKEGQKFNKLTIMELVGTQLYINPKGRELNKKYYKCKCDCGNEVILYQGEIISGHTKSCGCLHVKHGLWKSRLYNIRRGMLKRCYLKTNKDYKNYGGRGIKICDEWKNDFKAFYDWAMNNGYKENLTLDRIDVNGNYEPSNCRWVTSQKQANNRTSNRLISYNGETHNITEWAKILNIPRYLIYQRIKANWSIEKIFGETSKNG